MKFYLNSEEKESVQRLFNTLALKQPNRKSRRNFHRIANKFSPETTQVFLKPSERIFVFSVLANAVDHIDQVDLKDDENAKNMAAKCKVNFESVLERIGRKDVA